MGKASGDEKLCLWAQCALFWWVYGLYPYFMSFWIQCDVRFFKIVLFILIMLVPSESVCITIQIHFDVQQFPFLFKVFHPKKTKKNPQKMLWLSKLFNRLLMKPLCHSLAIGHMPREAELLEQTGEKKPTAIHYRNDMRSYSCSIHAPSASSLLSATPWNVDRCKGQQLIYHAEALWP